MVRSIYIAKLGIILGNDFQWICVEVVEAKDMKKGVYKVFKLLTLIVVFISLNSCGLVKAINYSFYVPEHGEYEINGKCYGIENQPGERLLITDCGGYINVLISTFTLGLSFSSERIVRTYNNAAKVYLGSKYEGCEISKLTDLGGRIFEIFYTCNN